MDICSVLTDKFLRYVKVDTQSSETSGKSPSTEKQKNLGRMLTEELRDMGADEVYFDDEHCYVYAKIHASDGRKDGKKLAFISHMDTSPEVTDENVNPRIVKNYDGKDIDLGGDGKYILSTEKFPALKNYVGQTLITTDGSTLLGADDKAGVSEIMTMAEYLITHPEEKHGEIRICFTPDEEIGEGVDHIDLDRLDADYAYTVDGGAFGEIEYENFNAAGVRVIIKGVSVHPGDAKNTMVNASLVAIELNDLLPKNQRPDNTEGYQGFYHLTDMKGTVDEAEISYIIRDHDMSKFLEKKALMSKICDVLNQKYGAGTCELQMRDQYYNMKEKIEPENIFLIEKAKKHMRELGQEPIIKPIRGGTDGARLSFMGLPCPNLCTGGHNYHGRFEYACVESMEKTAKLLIAIAKDF